MTTKLRTTTLGDDLVVSVQGFGGMAVTHAYGGVDDEQALRTLDTAIDLGVTFIDTADVYGKPREGATGPAGTNEELIARVLDRRRDEVTIATKFGITGAVGEGVPVRGDRDYVRAACEASLRRLGIDTIDLYYMHRRQLDLPIEETIGAMAELVTEGKVRHLGVSEVTADELRAACAVHPIAAVQSEWSVWSRDVEAHVVPAAIELGVGFVPYSPLGRGFLTGTVTREQADADVRAQNPRFGENFDANLAIVDALRAAADECGATPAQVALAWLYRRGEQLGIPVVPIPGTRSPERVAENAAAAGLRLDDAVSAATLARLDAAADEVVGSRNFRFASDDWISAGRE